ncbi:response regulator transcription factor [Silvimonas amylolytica]|uniref:HTH luxR-type domain-containing protein n=1 Tax=Silvimonas amylolytica TaxID=449663 RepID=A0ABQ2PG97_9NEIS|nr:response regulator transcription factor [Silvimonas amylolytica]GGP24401.1 hypothetical protein GCM10010971_02200 [Silvimonas amylolytica]
MIRHSPLNVVVAHPVALVAAGVLRMLAQVPMLNPIPLSHGDVLAMSFAQVDVLVSDAQTACGFARRLSGGSRYPEAAPRLLVVAPQEREYEICGAVSCGVHGYLLTDCTRETLLSAIYALAAGKRVLADAVSQRLLDGLLTDELTPREREVLSIMATGAPNKVIAQQLGTSPTTVRSRISAILTKLGAATRTQAVLIAQSRGLLDHESEDLPGLIDRLPGNKRLH